MGRKRRLRILARVGWWSRNRAEEEREKEWGEMAPTFLAWDIQLTMDRMVSKSYQQNSGPFSIVSSFLHESNERQTKRESSTTKRKKNGQIEVAVEQVGEQRMQVDGLTGGVSLTDRISGGFNIKDGRSNQAQDPRRPSTTPPTLWTVPKTPASSCIKQQEEWLSK